MKKEVSTEAQTTNLFKPDDPATRAEAACLLFKMIEKMQQ